MEELDIVNALEDAVGELEGAGEALREAGRKAANSAADYENSKNAYVIELKNEELKDPKIKRTDAIRQSMYRDQFKDLRRVRMVNSELWEAEKLAFRGLLSKVSALQTLLSRFRDEIR